MADQNPLLRSMSFQEREDAKHALEAARDHIIAAWMATRDADRLQIAARTSAALGEIVVLLETLANVRQAEF